MKPPSKNISISPEIQTALNEKSPIVALESTVITHGLPQPDNFELASDMEKTVREHGATPAMIAVIKGKIIVGLSQDQLSYLASAKNPRKISRRDFAGAIVKGENGGTTVAGTLIVADKVGIKTFATGGIGGVHRFPPFDISTDLQQLARTAMIVVCAGVKSILDIPATLEYMETYGIPVVGYQTDEFPAFYSKNSGLEVSERMDSAEEIAELALTQWQLEINSSLLVAVPPPAHSAIPADEINKSIERALKSASENNIRGQAITPYLLKQVSEITAGKSKIVNIDLLLNNAMVGAQIAVALASQS